MIKKEGMINIKDTRNFEKIYSWQLAVLALQLLKYGKSMSEWSAAHMKLE